MVTHGEKRSLPVGNFAAASREKPMAIDSSSDAARGEPPSHHESECVMVATVACDWRSYG